MQQVSTLYFISPRMSGLKKSQAINVFLYWFFGCILCFLKCFYACFSEFGFFRNINVGAMCWLRSVFWIVSDWLQGGRLRRRVYTGLNKDEARNTLVRAVLLNQLCDIRDCGFEQQICRVSELALVSVTIVFLNSVYLEWGAIALGVRWHSCLFPSCHRWGGNTSIWPEITFGGTKQTWDLPSLRLSALWNGLDVLYCPFSDPVRRTYLRLTVQIRKTILYVR